MDHLQGAFCGGLEAELPEQLQHRAIFRQYFRRQFLKARLTRQDSQMAHKDCPDALTLVGVDDDERHLCATWLDVDVTAAAHDSRPPILGELGNERDVGLEINIEEEGHLPFG